MLYTTFCQFIVLTILSSIKLRYTMHILKKRNMRLVAVGLEGAADSASEISTDAI